MTILQMKITEYCPLCNYSGQVFYKHIYYRCTKCYAIFKAMSLLPGPNEEKKRYLEHNNDIYDPAYQQFVSPITDRVQKNYTHGSLGLDFGSGTGPVISKVLTNLGYEIRQFDPFFCDNADELQVEYDYIVCCEVIEHFYNPAKEFQLLKSLLKPKGHLYCMTHLYSDEIDFDKWYYKNDSTHVFIYHRDTLDWVKRKYSFSSVSVDGRFIIFEN